MLQLKRIPKFIYFDAKNVLVSKIVYEGDYIAKELGFNPNDYDDMVKKTIQMIGDVAVERFNEIHTLKDEIGYFNWFNKYLCEYVGTQWTKELGERITDFHIHQNYKLEDGVFETLQKLHKKYSLGVISNALPSRRYHELKLGGIDQFLAHIVISSEEGSIKPYPRIFNIAIEKAGVDPKDILFIDDKVSFLEGAEAVGIDNLVLLHKKDVSDKYPMISSIKELVPVL